MKVLVLHPALTPYRVDLFNALAKHVTLHVVFLQPNATSQNFNIENLKKRCSFSHEWLTSGYQIRGIYFRTGLLPLLHRIKPDVVISHEFLGVSLQIIFLRVFARIPSHFLWTAENPEIDQSHSVLRKLIKRFFLSSINGLIVYSHNMSLVYQKSYKFFKYNAIVPNVPNPAIFRNHLIASESLSLDLITNYGWRDTKLLLFVGRLSPEKSVDRLLFAWAAIKHNFPYCSIVIAGDGIEKPSLIRLSQQLGVSNSVLFIGKQDTSTLFALYRIGSLLVLPSSYEPFGAVVNEALCAGVPVICTSDVGAKVLIKPHLNGTIVDGNSPSDLSEAISEWLIEAPTASERLHVLPPSLLDVDFDTTVTSLVSTLKSSLIRRSKQPFNSFSL